jgi:hypothetical protein
LEQIVIAEHACADYAFVSERETCMRSFLAASHVQNVASRESGDPSMLAPNEYAAQRRGT